MADVLKCTKIVVVGESLVTTNAYTVDCYFVNPGTTPPTPGQVRAEISKADMSDPAAMQVVIDQQLSLIGSNNMNWDA